MENNNAWTALPVEIREELISSLICSRFHQTMPVQEAAIPLLLKNYDLAVEAQTGSGKTLAFVVPLLHRYLAMTLSANSSQNKVKFLVLSPTRELCQQTFSVIHKLLSNLKDAQRGAQYLKFVKCATGGNELKDDMKEIQGQAIVLIGTVGRLKELSAHFEAGWLKKTDYLYIDEADRVLKENGINQLIRQFQKVRRTAMFSATLQSLQPKDYEFYGMRNLAKISLKPVEKQKMNSDKASYIIPASLHNTYMVLSNRLEKINFLIMFLQQHLSNSKTIVFFSTCASVEFYAKLFADLFQKQSEGTGALIHGIHGKLKNKRRSRILNQFTAQERGCLMATDVVSRGIDFDYIHYIIQIDPPEDPDNYIHRIGRTARINRPGTAILLIEQHEQAFVNYLANKSVGVKNIEPSHFVKGFASLENVIKGAHAQIDRLMLSDRDYIEKSKKAFVSYIRSYKQHDLKYIFEFKNISIGFTAQSFFLLRIPRVKEILGKKIEDFHQSQVDPESIPWQNRNQELQYSEKRIKLQQMKQSREKIKQREESRGDIKNNKSKRKKLKKKLQKKTMKNMNRDYQSLKKQRKAGFKNAHSSSQDCDEDEDTEQIERKLGLRPQ